MNKINKFNYIFMALFVLCVGFVYGACTYTYSNTDADDYFLVDNNASAPNVTVMNTSQDFEEYVYFTPRLNFTRNVSGTLTGKVATGSTSLRWITPLNISPSFVLVNGTSVVASSNYTLTKNVDTWNITFTDSRYNGSTLIYYFNRTFVACKVGLVEGLTCDDLIMNASKVYSTATTADFLVLNNGSGYGGDATFYMNPDSLGNFTQDNNWAVGWEYTEVSCTLGEGCSASASNLWGMLTLIVVAGFLLYLVATFFEGSITIAVIVYLAIIAMLIPWLINILNLGC